MKQWRLNVIFAIFFVVAALTMGRLFYLQIYSHKFYAALALGQQTGFKEIQGRRGEVFFGNSKETQGQESRGEVKSLAINKERWNAYAIPKNIEDKKAFAVALAPVLYDTEENMLAKMAESDTYVILRKNLNAQEKERLEALRLAGLYFESSIGRHYPQERLASQAIGFVGGDGGGQYGIEGYYENILRGDQGIQEDLKGFAAIGEPFTQQDLDGSDLQLTIDYNIQFEAESLLQEVHEKLDMEAGQIVVIKPDTGRVLALANFPSFDPNQYGKETDYAIFQNGATQKIFEPGSIFKPFTMAMALNEGKVSPQSTFNDTGSVTIGPDTIYNFNREKYGHGDMSRILEKSINTGAVFLQQQVGSKTFFRYAESFGFTQKTGVDLQGEVFSRNEVLRKGSPFGFATASFGQGIEVTPMQLVGGFAAFANGGKTVKPYVVEKISRGAEETRVTPGPTQQVIAEKTAQEVRSMLINVVEKGFGDIAKIPGYYLAGKTGTAEVPLKDGKGYYADRTIQSFIGFGPALDPQFLILVKLDNPKVPKSSLSAAPVFRKLAQYIINYWQIPPDY